MKKFNFKHTYNSTKWNMMSTLKHCIITVAWIACFLLILTGCTSHFDKTAEQPSSSTDSSEINTNDGSTEPDTEVIDEMTALQAFYDDFEANGTYDNLVDMVKQYNLYMDSRLNGTGGEYFKVAFAEDLAKVISNSDLETAGNYVVIQFNLLQNKHIDSIILHTDEDDHISSTNESIEPKEMNSLLALFASLSTSMTRNEIDTYIADNDMVKYAFARDSAYYIGYDSSAIRQRGRDREGEAVDINFVTNGNDSKIGMVKSAEYAVHTGSSTHYALKFDHGVFYYEGEICSSGEEAVQKFLAANQ